VIIEKSQKKKIKKNLNLEFLLLLRRRRLQILKRKKIIYNKLNFLSRN